MGSTTTSCAFPMAGPTRLKVRSMVGLLPLCATTSSSRGSASGYQRSRDVCGNGSRRMPELCESIHPTGPGHLGVGDRGIAALVNPDRLRRILSRMLDENEFLSPYGIRALSRYHADHPYVFNVKGQEYRVNYLPAESDTGMFGGNSNWRGPIWMPVNALLIRALLSFYLYYGDNFKIECPTGSGKWMNLFEVAREIANRLTRIFLRDESGRRPVYGGTEKFQTDPQWKDYILFYEYFHGDNGAGLGASHQTGWTGVVAKLIEIFGRLDAEQLSCGRQPRSSSRTRRTWSRPEQVTPDAFGAFLHSSRKHFLNPVIRICIGDRVEFTGASRCGQLEAPGAGVPEPIERANTLQQLRACCRRRTKYMRLHGPLADDPTARVLDSLLWGVLCWSCGLWHADRARFFTSAMSAAAVGALCVAPATRFAMILLRRGRLRAAGAVCLFGIWLMATALIIQNRDPSSVAIVYYIALPVTGAWLFGFRAALGIAGLCARDRSFWLSGGNWFRRCRFSCRTLRLAPGPWSSRRPS